MRTGKQVQPLWRAAYLAAGVCLFACGVSGAQDAVKPHSFEVASVKRSACELFAVSPPGLNTYSVRAVSLTFLIGTAYGVSDTDIVGGPSWRGSECFELQAKAEDGVSLSYANLRPRLQALLADRFHLVTHREMKDVAGYRLVVLKSGSKLKPSAEAASTLIAILPNGLRVGAASTDSLAATLARVVGRPVVNETRLIGNYEIVLDYAPEGSTDSSQPSVFTAVQEQLGLKLESQPVRREVIVVDRVERPTPE
jgi:uncharacterized protein (TIGR03435 family)